MPHARDRRSSVPALVAAVMTDVGVVDEAPLAGIRILVVDDDPDALELVSYSLQKRGARVEAASNAFDAFDLATLDPPDVLVSDIGMPGRDGYSLVRALRAHELACASRVPAIALTAFGTVRDVDNAVSAGFDVHMRKPVDLDALCKHVKSLAGSRSQA
jgi:CheY-like chemotaxis protein